MPLSNMSDTYHSFLSETEEKKRKRENQPESDDLLTSASSTKRPKFIAGPEEAVETSLALRDPSNMINTAHQLSALLESLAANTEYVMSCHEIQEVEDRRNLPRLFSNLETPYLVPTTLNQQQWIAMLDEREQAANGFVYCDGHKMAICGLPVARLPLMTPSSTPLLQSLQYKPHQFATQVIAYCP